MKNGENDLKIIRKGKYSKFLSSDDAINSYYRNRVAGRGKKEQRPIDKEAIRRFIGGVVVCGWTIGNTVGTYFGLRPIDHPFKIIVLLIGIAAGLVVGVASATVLNIAADAYIDSINDEKERRGL
jgi:F0F1-type ATP synthase assembly protein I